MPKISFEVKKKDISYDDKGKAEWDICYGCLRYVVWLLGIFLRSISVIAIGAEICALNWCTVNVSVLISLSVCKRLFNNRGPHSPSRSPAWTAVSSLHWSYPLAIGRPHWLSMCNVSDYTVSWKTSLGKVCNYGSQRERDAVSKHYVKAFNVTALWIMCVISLMDGRDVTDGVR